MTKMSAADYQEGLNKLENLSIEALESMLGSHSGYPNLPTKPRLAGDACPVQLRAHADALEAYEAAMMVYRQGVTRFHENNARVQDAWRKKLRETYASIPEPVYSVLYAKAYADGHSAGYEEVRNVLDGVVSFYEDIKAAEGK